ncbi:MAG: type III-B CRISPR module-associated protein Cmr5 [Ktedonobacteraceae bacterium]|nr:type III-B CRISPR module-associated protein Cmr5 [Ktedonobacteraceae bacterium]
MMTRDQCYAQAAHKRVSDLKQKYEQEEQKLKTYGSMAHKLPVLIRSAGLAQALTFLYARQLGLQGQLLTHLAETIGKEDDAHLLKDARNAPLREYMRLTQQVLDALLWYKRFAQSVLGVQPGEQTEEEVIENG